MLEENSCGSWVHKPQTGVAAPQGVEWHGSWLHHWLVQGRTRQARNALGYFASVSLILNGKAARVGPVVPFIRSVLFCSALLCFVLFHLVLVG